MRFPLFLSTLSPLPAACLSIAAALFMPAALASPWSSVDSPADGPARSIGVTNNGCISGAEPLPLRGTGYEVMHLERNRYYGHPQLIDLLQTLGQQVAARQLGLLHIGDLGQPRGGPMAFGHRSHQTGLDVDVWFDLDPQLSASANAQRSNVNALSMLNANKKGLNAIWSPDHAQVLELAANLPGVDRIFVNPYIKRELCQSVTGKRDWLRKIRPWYYHDDHFHLRMACPPDSPHCDTQDPLPAGEGCDAASLDWWFGHLPDTAPRPHPAPTPHLPQECQAVLNAP